MAPVTGTTHEIKMVGDDKGYRFEPANLTIKAGDAVKFTFVSGGPHNVAFEGATLAADVKAQLDSAGEIAVESGERRMPTRSRRASTGSRTNMRCTASPRTRASRTSTCMSSTGSPS